MRNIFAERVLRRISDLKINQSILAERLKTTPGVVSKTLNEARNPREETIKKWADALETTPEYLLGHDADNTDALRLACISAILKADIEDLTLIRDTLPDLFTASPDKPKNISSP